MKQVIPFGGVSVDNRDGLKTEISERFRAKANGRKASWRRKIVARRSKGAERRAVGGKKAFPHFSRKGPRPEMSAPGYLHSFVKSARRAKRRSAARLRRNRRWHGVLTSLKVQIMYPPSPALLRAIRRAIPVAFTATATATATASARRCLSKSFSDLQSHDHLNDHSEMSNLQKSKRTDLTNYAISRNNCVRPRDAVETDHNVRNVGQLVVLPSTFTGGPRYMHEKCQEAMTSYVKHHEAPDLFITMTCNPNWPEITNKLFPGQNPTDRHDLIARLFRLKVQTFMYLVDTQNIYGIKRCHVYTIEWQKRGLPHVHFLSWMVEKIRPDQIDSIDTF